MGNNCSKAKLPRSIEADFSKGRKLRWHAYNSLTFSNAFEVQAKTPLLSRMQEFPKLLPTLNLTESTNHDPANRQKILEEWAILFNKVFFGGNVRTGPVQYTLSPPEAGVSDAICWFNNETKKIHLNLENRNVKDGESESEYTCSLISALLHEMLHAFIDFYSDKKDLPAAKGGEGENGHGPVWADCMIILQDWLQPAIEWDPYCQIACGVSGSMEAEGWEATNEQLARWGVLQIYLDGEFCLVDRRYCGCCHHTHLFDQQVKQPESAT
ncbi:hypothetical protein GLAREA_06517 [Glarea lozoyensis ATCC 20868]|uniref:SprT-like domain-containing protein n=1 Tax=Glarea lozoyensis (strain ATCC 20868 / MF5171) TaxID=1116229 RepID=S3D8L9_GLAL2|nr:uncharacterized protein GLAREA_06517 [Glarea lozoyensis ATCC 20868]EPE33504.1 hypothetical protein GLAREA_06517 [Glarea lozoyensis ATCC 20868]